MVGADFSLMELESARRQVGGGACILDTHDSTLSRYRYQLATALQFLQPEFRVLARVRFPLVVLLGRLCIAASCISFHCETGLSDLGGLQ